FEFLREKEDILGLEEAQFYHDFPVLKDLDDDVVISKILILSREHGVVIISTSNVSSEQIAIDELRNLEEQLDHVFRLIYARLLRNKGLLKTRMELAFPINSFIFAPFVENYAMDLDTECPTIFTRVQLEEYLNKIRIAPIDSSVFGELRSTI